VSFTARVLLEANGEFSWKPMAPCYAFFRTCYAGCLPETWNEIESGQETVNPIYLPEGGKTRYLPVFEIHAAHVSCTISFPPLSSRHPRFSSSAARHVRLRLGSAWEEEVTGGGLGGGRKRTAARSPPAAGGGGGSTDRRLGFRVSGWWRWSRPTAVMATSAAVRILYHR
jgi:hypothetical protein